MHEAWSKGNTMKRRVASEGKLGGTEGRERCAQLMDVRTGSLKGECAMGTGQRSSDAVKKGAQIFQ